MGEMARRSAKQLLDERGLVDASMGRDIGKVVLNVPALIGEWLGMVSECGVGCWLVSRI